MSPQPQFLNKCTDHLLKIFANAAHKATAEGKKKIEPAHLFFGLTHQTPKIVPSKKKKPLSLALSPVSSQILTDAAKISEHYRHEWIGPEHLFMSMLHNETPSVKKLLKTHRIDPVTLKNQLVSIVNHSSQILNLLESVEHHRHGYDDHTESNPEKKQQPSTRKRSPSALEYFTVHLTDPRVAATIDPVIGRAKEIDRLIRILARRTKNNPVLIGEAGVGKTAIVEGLAKRIVAAEVPEYLKNKHIYSLDMTSLMAGSGMRGELEVRLGALMDEMRTRPDAFLFVDEIHNLVGTGGMHGTMDAANILKPALARGELRCIGATTFDEYKQSIEDDPALERRFQPIVIDQPSAQETEEILKGVLPYYEQFHGVTFDASALHTAVSLSDRYLSEKYFPDKAIDVIDEAAAKIKIQSDTPALITSQIIADIIASMTGIPSSALSIEEKNRFLDLEAELSRFLVGQDHVKKMVAHALRRAKAGLREKGRPLASFLFLGPSGVGKTELAKTLSRQLFTANGLIKLDMSEFSESFTLSRLIGSPNGYVGYKDGGVLTEGVRRHPHSLVLFDEIEKAHPRVLNILLQILDDGVLTDMTGKRVDFSNTIIVLTSNIGSEHWNGKGTLGFASEQSTAMDTKDRVRGDVKKFLNPELVNRIDHVLVFDTLEKGHLRDIVSIHLKELGERLSKEGTTLLWNEKVIDAILAKDENKQSGARHIRHSIEEHIEDLIANELLKQGDKKNCTLTLEFKKNSFVCRAT